MNDIPLEVCRGSADDSRRTGGADRVELNSCPSKCGVR